VRSVTAPRHSTLPRGPVEPAAVLVLFLLELVQLCLDVLLGEQGVLVGAQCRDDRFHLGVVEKHRESVPVRETGGVLDELFGSDVDGHDAHERGDPGQGKDEHEIEEDFERGCPMRLLNHHPGPNRKICLMGLSSSTTTRSGLRRIRLSTLKRRVDRRWTRSHAADNATESAEESDGAALDQVA
jgi:hypothetical protein